MYGPSAFYNVEKLPRKNSPKSEMFLLHFPPPHLSIISELIIELWDSRDVWIFGENDRPTATSQFCGEMSIYLILAMTFCQKITYTDASRDPASFPHDKLEELKERREDGKKI